MHAQKVMLSDNITRKLIWIALFAIALRLGYQSLMLEFGGSYDNGSDSGKYLGIARDFLTLGWAAKTRDHLELMPLYPGFLATIFQVAGGENLRAVVTIQAFVDALNVFGIGVAARSLSERSAIPSAFCAAIAPNFLVHASYVLTETVFIFFFSWGLCALLWSLRRKTLLLLAVSGIFFGCALLTRPVMMYYSVALAPTLTVALWIGGKRSLLHASIIASIPVLLILATATPRAVDHYRQYGYMSLSTQGGTHLLNWFYGCLASATPCAERNRVFEEMRPVVQERIDALGKDADNPFAIAAVTRGLAIEKILSTPPELAVTSMITGMLRVLMQTGFYETFAQFRQQPAFFSATPGNSMAERFTNFTIANKMNVFMILWGLAQIALVLSRAVQLAGLVNGFQTPAYRGATLILAVTIAYFLILTGPVASPKYRMPIEPPLLILFGVGWVWMCDRMKRYRR